MSEFHRILKSVRKQYEAMWQMCLDSIEKCDQSNWKKEIDDSYFVPSRIVLHIIETVDYYLDEQPDSFSWGLMADVENCSSENLPDKRQLINYLSRVREKSLRWLAARVNKNLNLPEGVFNTDWETDIERAIYALRHSQHHIGQLSLDFQRRGLKAINWK